MGLNAIIGVVASLVMAWALLALFLVLARPKGGEVGEVLRLLPDALRLFRNLAADPELPRGVRIRLALLFLYFAFPIDLIPDFIPIIGYADDVIIACFTLRSVVRLAGADAIRRHWPGTTDGLDALWRAAGLPHRHG